MAQTQFTFKVRTQRGKVEFREVWRSDPTHAAQVLKEIDPSITILGVADPGKPFPSKLQASYVPVKEAQKHFGPTWNYPTLREEIEQQ